MRSTASTPGCAGARTAEPVLVVANFTPVPREAYKVGVPFAGRWSEVINSDADTYAGSNYGNGGGASPRMNRIMVNRCRCR